VVAEVELLIRAGYKVVQGGSGGGGGNWWYLMELVVLVTLQVHLQVKEIMVVG
jgi:hypothetical protein